MDRLGARIVLLWGWRRFAVAFVSGALLVLAQAPYDFFAVGFVSFPVLVWLLDGAASDAGARFFGRLRPGFAVGWWFGFGYFIAGLWWIGNALLVEADQFAWALPLAVIALPALLAIFYGLATVAARMFWSDGLGRIAALAVSFAVVEWLRGVILTGFPWNAIGYAAAPTPLLMQSVGVIGMTGMTALSVFVFAMPAMASTPRWRKAGVAFAALIAALHVGYGYVRLSQAAQLDGTTLQVRLVQPSIMQSEKWDKTRRDEIFGTYLEMSAAPPQEGQAEPKLVIWPETAVPFILNERPDALSTLGDLLQEGEALMAGAVRSEGSGAQTRYYNAILSVGDAGEVTDAIDKVHLVPFGEYLPFSALLERIGLGKLVALPEDFSSGGPRRPLKLPGGLSAVAFICYEVIFEDVVRRDAKGSDLLLNITNDAWFGRTAGPYQHFRQAQIRAAENGLPLIRAANSGVTGVVDAYGRVVDALDVNAVGVLDVAVPLGKVAPLVPWDNRLNGWSIAAALFLLALGSTIASKGR